MTKYLMDVEIDGNGIERQLRYATYDQALALFEFVRSQRVVCERLERVLMQTIRGEMP